MLAQAALAAAHQAAEEVLRRGEARHAEALASASAARDAVLGRLAATEAEFRQALQVVTSWTWFSHFSYSWT
jgi:hypothetical protein